MMRKIMNETVQINIKCIVSNTRSDLH